MRRPDVGQRSKRRSGETGACSAAAGVGRRGRLRDAPFARHGNTIYPVRGRRHGCDEKGGVIVLAPSSLLPAASL